MKVVGFTGTQEGMSSKQISALRRALLASEAVEFHHGDCIGADEEADAIARELNLQIHIHPPLEPRKQAFCSQKGDVVYKKKEYLERNRDIVDASGLLIAAPRSDKEELRSGTWSTVRYARRSGVHVILLRR